MVAIRETEEGCVFVCIECAARAVENEVFDAHIVGAGGGQEGCATDEFERRQTVGADEGCAGMECERAGAVCAGGEQDGAAFGGGTVDFCLEATGVVRTGIRDEGVGADGLTIGRFARAGRGGDGRSRGGGGAEGAGQQGASRRDHVADSERDGTGLVMHEQDQWPVNGD